jgi:oligopeptidase B
MLLSVVAVMLVGCAGQKAETGREATLEPLQPVPPVAKVEMKRDTLFGVVMEDPYFWLRGRDNPEVIAYLNAENEYTDLMMAHTEGLQDTLFEEMKARIKENDLSVPVHIDEWYYFTKTEEGKEYRIHMRRPGDDPEAEQVVLDENVRAEGSPYYGLGIFAISPDHNLLAFAEDTTGREVYTLRFKDLNTGKILPDKIDSVYYSAAWSGDSEAFFYVTLDEALRPWRVHRHVIGTSDEDEIVYEDPDDRFFVEVDLALDHSYVMIVSESKLTSEVLVLPAGKPMGEFKSLLPRQQGHLYYADHQGDRFLITTNDKGVNFRLVSMPENSEGRQSWAEIVPHRDDVLLEWAYALEKGIVLLERSEAQRKLRVLDPQTGESRPITFDEEVYTVRPVDNADYHADSLRVRYSSPITPNSIYDVDLVTLERTLRKRDEVGGGFDPSQYVVQRVYATARDGAQIPVTVTMKKGTALDGSSPMLLYGYGSYGITYDPRFRSTHFSLIDRGFIYAMAHVRGSSAKGRPWYEDGKLLNKMNTFTDFIDVAETFVERKYTSPDRLTALGGSAGGLLIGAVANMRPDLFEAMVAAVPFVDIMNTMLDATIPLTVTEYEEWGNPNEEEYFKYMLSYSPYDNVKAQDYPDMLITAGLHDPRVQYWESAKWTSKLRATKTGGRILLKTNMEAGHGGASGRYGWLRETSEEYAFLIDAVQPR